MESALHSWFVALSQDPTRHVGPNVFNAEMDMGTFPATVVEQPEGTYFEMVTIHKAQKCCASTIRVFNQVCLNALRLEAIAIKFKVTLNHPASSMYIICLKVPSRVM